MPPAPATADGELVSLFFQGKSTAPLPSPVPIVGLESGLAPIDPVFRSYGTVAGATEVDAEGSGAGTSAGLTVIRRVFALSDAATAGSARRAPSRSAKPTSRQ